MGEPLDVLVVGWYPAGDDSFAGRFIADQVAALAATGRVSPTVATFENLPLAGDDRLRAAEDAAIDASLAGAMRVPALASLPEGAFGAPGIPVARLGVAAGAVAGLGGAHQEIHRRRSLLAFVTSSRMQWRLVHGHVGYPEGAAAAAAATALGIPFVLTEHATYLATFFGDPVLRERYLATARQASRILPVSRVLGNELIAEFPELAPKIVPIPNTVGINDFRVVPVAERRPDELLWVGYRKEIKGIDTLLRAFREVVAARPRLRLRLVGRSSTDDEEADWQRLANDLGIGGSVTFDGPADRAGVAAAMERATLFVHPSTRETFGVVAVEALSTGLPVVACDSGGVTEVLGDDPDRFGAIVPAGRPDQLAEAILQTLDRRDGFDPNAIRAAVEARFGTAAVAGRIADVYAEVLAEREAADRDSGAARRVAGPAVSPAPATARPVGAGGVRHLVVGFQRTLLARRLAATPTWVTDDAEIVTAGGRVDRATAAASERGLTIIDRRIVELVRWSLPPTGPQPARRRIRRWVTWPVRTLRLLRRRGWLERTVLAELGVALERAITEPEAVRAPGPVVLVCVAGIDHLVARPLVERGLAIVAPGGLRWLADVRWAGRSADDRSPGSGPEAHPEGGNPSSSTAARYGTTAASQL